MDVFQFLQNGYETVNQRIYRYVVVHVIVWVMSRCCCSLLTHVYYEGIAKVPRRGIAIGPILSSKDGEKSKSRQGCSVEKISGMNTKTKKT